MLDEQEESCCNPTAFTVICCGVSPSLSTVHLALPCCWVRPKEAKQSEAEKQRKCVHMAKSWAVEYAVTQGSCHDCCLRLLYCLQGCAEHPWGLSLVSSLLGQKGGLGLELILRQENKLTNSKERLNCLWEGALWEMWWSQPAQGTGWACLRCYRVHSWCCHGFTGRAVVVCGTFSSAMQRHKDRAYRVRHNTLPEKVHNCL